MRFKMASLLPLIQDILPMIMPSSISVTKAADILPPLPSPPPPSDANGTKETSRIRVLTGDAVINKTDKMCASVLLVTAKSSSTVRHHGEQDTIIYAASGRGVLLSNPMDESDEEPDPKPVRYALEQGDFAFVPAWTEHQVLNESDTEMTWIIIRSGPQPVEVNLTDWGGATASDPPKTVMGRGSVV
ncbi:RmlC-like cupin domain-containing protein [Apodospora peruviana]|uniref:RmlC-like cupin domain-containing protein n=1 Tax=Apodospora peruviana TaxID=516989 RepID=A0AAE0M7X2_9PEZI|nr:RmlC-like cupin domain-containing protein [Apodospora peruviana]